MLPPVQAHLQVLGENDIVFWVLVPVLAVQLPDAAPMGGAVFLTGPPVLTVEQYKPMAQR